MRESYKAMITSTKASLERLLKSGSQFVTSRDTEEANSLWLPMPAIPALGCTGMIDIALLIDFQRKCRPHAEQKDAGWFTCPAKEFRDKYGPHLGNLEKQTRMLNRLEAKGYIKRSVKGKPPLRYVWIDFDKLLGDCGKRQQELDQMRQEEAHV